jgi:hypothetical protein
MERGCEGHPGHNRFTRPKSVYLSKIGVGMTGGVTVVYAKLLGFFTPRESPLALYPAGQGRKADTARLGSVGLALIGAVRPRAARLDRTTAKKTGRPAARRRRTGIRSRWKQAGSSRSMAGPPGRGRTGPESTMWNRERISRLWAPATDYESRSHGRGKGGGGHQALRTTHSRRRLFAFPRPHV